MSEFEKQELASRYTPSEVEDKWYRFWEENAFFHSEADPNRKPYTIVIPPPNITGALHIGHAITATIEDILVRWHRMMGDPTLWLPGTDHASIATHAVVERELAKEGLTRWDLGREAFEQRVWQWSESYRRRITQQHRRLGASCDWTRERFTLDEVCSRAVRTAFKRLYDAGLIYRGSYLVNWCPRCGTAISDLEVIHEDEPSQLWYLRYPLADGDGFVEVATTRPETMLGDAGVAVNPKDERYSALIGRQVILPIAERRIPIIADDAVDPEFGTGAVKVTPAHDPSDYEMAQRHGLAAIDVMTPEGCMSEAAGSGFAGLDRLEARRIVLEELERQGLLARTQAYTHSVGHCQRCTTIAEPRISLQWFVNAKPLAERALAAVREGRVRIIPERWERVYYNWLENIRDWCISRQLWWGHRIPVWYCQDCAGLTVAVDEPRKCEHCGGPVEQDPDVLDTWFSSGLWPFSTLGWPEETEDYRYFYPASVLETGYDIIFFWVARMTMMGLAMTDREPFEYVYLHGMVRDELGRKYSKSLGNALDPLEVIEEYGTDALRFSLVTSSTPGNDAKLSPTKIEAARNFANKLWNAARFILANLPEGFETPRSDEFEDLALADRWILSRINWLIANADRLLRSWQLGEAGREVQDFLWGDFCDWYIEIAKIALYGEDEKRADAVRRVLVYVYERALRLLHPFMPFITEAIWQLLPHEGKALIVAQWPAADGADPQAEADFSLVSDIIRGIRNVRAEYRVEPARYIQAMVSAGDKATLFESQRDLIVKLAHVAEDRLSVAASLPAPTQAASVVTAEVTVYLPLAGMMELAAERERLQKAVGETRQLLANSDRLLANPSFTGRAKIEVVERERDKAEQLRDKLLQLEKRIEQMAE